MQVPRNEENLMNKTVVVSKNTKETIPCPLK